MTKLQLIVALSTLVAYPTLAQTPAAAPPAASAYDGTVGDWALGRWTGVRYLDAGFSRMATEDRVLVISKLPDGKVGCQWGTPSDVGRTGWAPRCTVTATTVSLRTMASAEVELNKEGVELDGRYVELGMRNKVHLHRSQDR